MERTPAAQCGAAAPLVTLKKNRDFGLVYSRGKSCATKKLVLICLPRRYGGVRVGFTVSKKVGCSVVRNKKRRQLKEAFRQFLPRLSGSAYVVFVARAPIVQADFWSIRKDMQWLLKRASLLQANEKTVAGTDSVL